jgi:PAB-dependent poly(A)-specific ribonuclease subunit 2
VARLPLDLVHRGSADAARTIMSTAASYNVIDPIIDPRTYSQPTTALSFDPVSDTLWAGRASGHVVAFHSARGMRGVVFSAGGHMPVTKIIAGETYVRALGQAAEGAGQWSKGGVNKWVQL